MRGVVLTDEGDVGDAIALLATANIRHILIVASGDALPALQSEFGDESNGVSLSYLLHAGGAVQALCAAAEFIGGQAVGVAMHRLHAPQGKPVSEAELQNIESVKGVKVFLPACLPRIAVAFYDRGAITRAKVGCF